MADLRGKISLGWREESFAQDHLKELLNLKLLKTLFCLVLNALPVVLTSEPLHVLCTLPGIVFPFSTEMLPLQRSLL